jgi:tRNA1(Val) A37 N6-methylase TrmN6
VNPFLIVLLPGQVRVFTGFAYNPATPETGAVTPAISTDQNITRIIEALSAFTADAINRGEIWQRNAEHLGAEQRVDTMLLKNLKALAAQLENDHSLPPETCHALIGKFVYLAYLRARDIISDKWLREEAMVEPTTIFTDDTFAPTVTLDGFRKLVRAVEIRFNGKLCPIAWGSSKAPRADAIRAVARVFSGEEATGQMHLSFRAYDFASIPVEFLSSIYEQFLHTGKNEDDAETDEEPEEIENEASDPEKRGAHYTPEPLADYLVSEINAVKPLRLGMRVLDPCCGSGVFLVVAFRRLVELECQQQNRTSLNASELSVILTTSIYAVERNPIACQIAGFSLILAMLSYVEPPELHRRKNFKFPTLVGNNLFPEDFFNECGHFWQQVVSPEGKGIKFDCIVGNPPWVELDKDDPEAAHLLNWSKAHTEDYALARARTGEAFAWRVMDCLADGGTVGLILHAKTLTNDHLKAWRQKFFSGVQVCRVTNFANLAYIIFASAQAPCATLIYTHRTPESSENAILHFGPFVANQCVTNLKRGTKRRAWAIGFSESEIKNIAPTEASTGSAQTWKLALWSTSRDAIALRRLKQVFTTTLGQLAASRKWNIELGLQLRPNAGTKKDPCEKVESLDEVPVLDHGAFARIGKKLVVPEALAKPNTFGTFVRIRGGTAGLKIIKAPHLLLVSDFAAYSDTDFIIRQRKMGIGGGTSDEMKAVAAVWNSNFAAYLLFFLLSSEWGIDRNLIDKGDAEHLPFPELTPERQASLCAAWEDAAALESSGAEFGEVKALLDVRVAAALGLPDSVVLVVGEFFRVRYQLNKGKSPANLRHQPDNDELAVYASRLKNELDGYLAGKAHHRIVVLHSTRGICASVTLTKDKQPIDPQVKSADGPEAKTLDALLRSAEKQFSQWVYVKRSVRIFDGDTIHLIKPPRRLEWTQTQAMLDADDIIAEVLEERQRRKG